MRTFALVFINSLRRMGSLVGTSFIVGILLCVLFGVFLNITPHRGDSLRLGYIDNDSSAVSADFERYLTERLGMELVEGDEAVLETELVEKRVSAIVEVPQGFGRAVLAGGEGALQTTFMDDYANRMLLTAYFEEYTASLALLASAAAGDNGHFEALLAETREQTTELTVVPLEGDIVGHVKDWAVFRSVMGFFLMIGTLLTIGMANILYDDRANGTYQRVRASNVPALSYVLGVCASGFVAVLLMVVVFVVYLGITGVGEVIPLGQMLLVCLLFGLFAVALALVLGSMLKSRNAIFFGALAISVISCLLGGGFFPVDYAPQFMQQFAHISPAFWFMSALEGLEAISLGTAGAAGEVVGAGAWLGSAGVLALFSLLGFLITAVSFASKQSSAN